MDSLSEAPSVDEERRTPPSHGSTAVGAGEAIEVQEQAEGGRGAASPAGLQTVRPGAEPTDADAEQIDPVLAAARRIAFLPVVQGGLGLRSSALLSPAAYWAAWADMLPTLVERVPDLAEQVLQELESGDSRIVSVAQAAAADQAVTRAEFPLKPTWRELAAGVRPPDPAPAYDEEPGQWPHGWQFYASLGLITHHRETAALPSLEPAVQARLRYLMLAYPELPTPPVFFVLVVQPEPVALPAVQPSTLEVAGGAKKKKK